MLRWTSVIVALVLAGCTTIPSVPGHVQTQRAAIKTSGGASDASASGGKFSADFSGKVAEVVCSPLQGGRFRFSGAGMVSFSGMGLKSATENGSLSGTYHVFGCSTWRGGTIFAIGNPAIGSIDFSVSSYDFTKGCVSGAQFAVTGGTKKFAKAAGRGTVAFTCSGKTYTDKWSGTITF